jgi:hypothetical protein
MLSIDLKMPMTFVISDFSPLMTQVTRDPVPSGSIVKTASLCALNGFRKARSICTLDGSIVSVISIRPSPTLRLPDQA